VARGRNISVFGDEAGAGGRGFSSISSLRYQSIGVRLNLVRIRAGQNFSTPSIFWRRLLPLQPHTAPGLTTSQLSRLQHARGLALEAIPNSRLVLFSLTCAFVSAGIWLVVQNSSAAAIAAGRRCHSRHRGVWCSKIGSERTSRSWGHGGSLVSLSGLFGGRWAGFSGQGAEQTRRLTI